MFYQFLFYILIYYTFCLNLTKCGNKFFIFTIYKMEYPENNSVYSWKDLKEIASIAEKAYNSENNTLEYYRNLEKNVIISPLLSKDKDNYKFNNNKEVFYIISEETNAEVYIFEYFDTLICSFTGTNSTEDAINDITVLKERIFLYGDFCYVHTGFYKEYHSIKYQILEHFNKFVLNKTNPHVLIIGHSLGVIGKFAGIEMKQLCNNAKIDSIGFGSPSLGDKKVAAICDKVFDNNIRIVDNDDPVPGALTVFGYCHSGKLILFDEDKVLYKMNKVYKNIRNACSLVLTKWIPSFGKDIVKYHSMKNYIAKLEFVVKKIFIK